MWSISIITYSQTSDGYPTGYQISRIDHHKTSKLSSVFQRWDKQLFMSMYDESKCTENIVEPVRVTRQALELNLRQYKLHNKKYTKSPWIRGKCIWDKLSHQIQQLPCKFAFKNKSNLKHATYNETYLEQEYNIPLKPAEPLDSSW